MFRSLKSESASLILLGVLAIIVGIIAIAELRQTGQTLYSVVEDAA